MLFVAIEGVDGSGKGTQTKLLVENLRGRGINAVSYAFPQYEGDFGRLVARYLNGKYGQLHPEVASLLFSLDRFHNKTEICEGLAQTDVFVCDRFIASNMAHQAARTGSLREGEDLIRQICKNELVTFGLPRPDITICLDLDIRNAQRLIARKKARDYTALKADMHEADADYLSRVHWWYGKIPDLVDVSRSWIKVRVDDIEGDGDGIRPPGLILAEYVDKIVEALPKTV